MLQFLFGALILAVLVGVGLLILTHPIACLLIVGFLIAIN